MGPRHRAEGATRPARRSSTSAGLRRLRYRSRGCGTRRRRRATYGVVCSEDRPAVARRLSGPASPVEGIW